MSTYISDEKIAEIKESCNIVHLISECVPLKKAGTNYKGLCPFHSEKTPSFTVSESKQIFHCFGCGTGGNIFTFLMKFEHLSFPEAAQKLADKSGVELPRKEAQPFQRQAAEERAQLFNINERAAEYFSEYLIKSKEGEKARTYLKKRGISQDTIVDYQLGFAPGYWEGLSKLLKKRGGSLALAQKVGLLKAGKQGDHYDFFRNRIIFPIINYNKKIIGFGGRTIGDDSAKYINSSDSLVYKKSKSLYGLNVAIPFIRQEASAILVEGYFDLLSLHQHGIKNVVASLGTALTDGQIKLLKRFTNTVFVAFDTDESGINATIKSLPLFLDNEISPHLVVLPPGVDPDSFVLKEKNEGFRKKLNQAIPLMEFFIDTAIKKHGTATISGKLNIIRAVSPLLSKLRDTTERNLYIQRIAQQIDVDENTLRSELHTEKISPAEVQELVARDAHAYKAEKLILKLMILYPEVIPHVKKMQLADEFFEPTLKKLFFFLIECFDHNQVIEPDSLITRAEEEVSKNLVAELVMRGEHIIDVAKTLNNSIQKLRTMNLKKQIQLLNNKIKEAERGHDESAMKRFLEHKQKLITKRKEYSSDQFSIQLQ